MTTRPTPAPPWDDERLAAAFAARAAQAVTPVDLARGTSALLRTRASSAGTWRRLMAPAAVVILAIGAVSGGLALRGASGVVESPGAPTLESSAFPSAPEAAGLIRSTFTIESGPIDRPVSIEVLDRTGFVEDARAARPNETAAYSDIPGPGKLAFANLSPDTILVRWSGTVCDRRPQLTVGSGVADGPPSMLHLTDKRPGCDTMAIGRGVVLRLSTDVDAGALEGTEAVQLLAEPLLEPTTMVVEMERGDSTESILIIDHAASLVEARAANPVAAIPDFTGVRIVSADDGGTIVMWDGAMCDRDLWISIEAGDLGPPDRIVVHGERVEPCRLMLVRRAIWLDLGPVDVASIKGQLSVRVRTSAERDAGPVVGVPEALVVRSHPGDDHQLQVRGWYWRDPAVYDCFVPPSPPPALESGCQGPRDRFVADPNDLAGQGFVVWLRPGVETSLFRYGDPSEVVIVGHFDDSLAEACAVSTRESCGNVFVIEEVLPASAP